MVKSSPNIRLIERCPSNGIRSSTMQSIAPYDSNLVPPPPLTQTNGARSDARDSPPNPTGAFSFISYFQSRMERHTTVALFLHGSIFCSHLLHTNCSIKSLTQLCLPPSCQLIAFLNNCCRCVALGTPVILDYMGREISR
ncbi:hypothetical protein CDL15_Pgr000161 [Punica granatum]|uniref:Uncharacterized protein n=1 Tax=Punica granatum TaxID=22663 RepID=A0A218Y1N9_PUNGR|nr:hypothetical protein CDL15_Pgr000161 [Punica granatum]